MILSPSIGDPREGRGYVAFWDFIPVLVTPEKAGEPFRPLLGTPRRQGL